MRRGLGAWFAFGMLAVAPLHAGAEEALEASVKAAYLYKFLGYVDWPAGTFASPDAPHVVGVVGADDVHAELLRLVAGRQVNGRGLVVKRIASGDSLDGLQVLYIGRAARASALLPQLAGRPVLAVTDVPSGLVEGSALNFVLVQGRVRFEASLPAAERAGIKLSARLLAVAERVVTP